MIPDTAKEKPQEGEVVAVGDGKVLDSGTKVEMSVKPGDRIRLHFVLNAVTAITRVDEPAT